MSRGPFVVVALHCSIVACATLIGCSSGTTATPCSTNDDCASHFCKADGTCAPVAADGAPGGDSGSGSGGIDAPSVGCAPNQDGMITRAELPLVAGNTATFRTTTSGAFSTAGTGSGSGRAWDLSGALSGDADGPTTLLAPTAQWWASDFPTATYAVTLAAGSDLLGVFHVDDSAVTLLGVVSPTAGTFQTELTYSPAAKVLALPLTASSSFQSTSTVTGTAQGVFVTYDETYTSQADQVGTMKTPYGTFPVIRVGTDLARTSGITTLLTKRQYGWFAECFGGVATVISKDNETHAEFTSPAEITRIAP